MKNKLLIALLIGLSSFGFAQINTSDVDQTGIGNDADVNQLAILTILKLFKTVK